MTPDEFRDYQDGIDMDLWRHRLVFWLDWKGHCRTAKRLAAKWQVPY